MTGPRVTPYQLEEYAQPAIDIYIALENRLFELIAQRLLAPRDAAKDYVLQWQIEKARELNILNRETIEALAEATGLTVEAITESFMQAGSGIIDTIDEQLKRVSKNRPPKPSNINLIVAAYVNQTFRELDNFVNQTLITTNFGAGTVGRMYTQILNETTAQVLAGNATINKALAETVTKYRQAGLKSGFVDRGGHNWSVEGYVKLVLRTTTNRAYNELRLSRMDDFGVEFVRVSTQRDARPYCSRCQGTVLSVKEVSSDPRYKTIYDFGYGLPEGLRGINCRHILYPFDPEINVNNENPPPPEEAVERFEMTQKQRYYERQIRRAKESLQLAEVIGEEDVINKYKKQIRDRQAKLRDFIEKEDLPRRRDNEQIIK